MEWPFGTLFLVAKSSVSLAHGPTRSGPIATSAPKAQWITLVEHGGLTALKDTYARALASRYGNPDRVLARDYVPEIPGVNAPGSYDAYARDPGAYWTKWAKSIEDGSNKFFKP